MADLMIHGRAYRFRIGLVSGRGIVERCRDHFLDVDHKIMAKSIQLPCADPGTDIWRNEIQHIGSQPTGGSQLLDFFGILDVNGHGGMKFQSAPALDQGSESASFGT